MTLRRRNDPLARRIRARAGEAARDEAFANRPADVKAAQTICGGVLGSCGCEARKTVVACNKMQIVAAAVSAIYFEQFQANRKRKGIGA